MKKIYLILFGFLGFHLFLLINLQFTAWPEMVSFPFLKNNGFILYKDFVHPYPPLLTDILAVVYRIFDYKLIVLKIFTWTVILLNDLLIFLIVKKSSKKGTFALISVFAYVLLQPFLEGNELWFDLAIVPFILAGFLFLTNKKYLLAGTMLGLAALTKQNTGLFVIFAFLYLIFQKAKVRELAPFLVGPVFLFLILLVRLISENLLNDFLNWTLIYPATYWTKFPGYVEMAFGGNNLLVIVLLILPFLFFVRRLPCLFILFFLLSFVLIYPRVSFFHLQTFLAFAAISFGLIMPRIKFPITYCLAPIALIFLLVSRSVSWQKEARFWTNEDIKLAQVVRSRIAGNENVYLLGPSSAIYVFSGRLPAKPWFDNFGWYYEVPGEQEKVLDSWEANPPGKIVWQDPVPGNKFDLGTYRPEKITKWITGNYNRKEKLSAGIWLWEKK